MGKLPDILPNICMPCYYLQRVLCQLLGYVISVNKESKTLQPIVCHLSFNDLLFPLFDICKSMTVSLKRKLQIHSETFVVVLVNVTNFLFFELCQLLP